jgi:hypothetical protein
MLKNKLQKARMTFQVGVYMAKSNSGTEWTKATKYLDRMEAN